MLDLRILGPLLLQIGRQPVRLGPQQRTLLIVLILAHGGAIPATRLAELLWNDAPPLGATATLRSHVYHLRTALNASAPQGSRASVLVTSRVGSGFGYALHLNREQIDAVRFEQLITDARRALQAGQPTSASSLLNRALSLWRGEPLADVAGHPFATGEIRRLEELYKSALLARAEADIQCGAYCQAIGDLEAVLPRWPYDERLYRLLVISLHRSGRLGEAADVCRRAIQMMLDQGLDTRAMQLLQRQALQPHQASTPLTVPVVRP